MSGTTWLTLAFLGVVGVAILVALMVMVLRLGLAPVRTELARLTEELRLANEIQLDDDLQAGAKT